MSDGFELWCSRCGDRTLLPYTDDSPPQIDIRDMGGWESDGSRLLCPCCAAGKHVRLERHAEAMAVLGAARVFAENHGNFHPDFWLAGRRGKGAGCASCDFCATYAAFVDQDSP